MLTIFYDQFQGIRITQRAFQPHVTVPRIVCMLYIRRNHTLTNTCPISESDNTASHVSSAFLENNL